MQEHKCQNCGSCCGPIVATKSEIAIIKSYVKKLPKRMLSQLCKQNRDDLTCQFRDIENKRCAIHLVRPEICKMFGIVKGMICPFGNTAELDGETLMDFRKRRYLMPEIIGGNK